ncbi:MAG TPA: hypothetical protein VNC85_07475 [Mycobacteriales bacterium]|nr:hypothetical protein [Mycobacteriales bacterium]
MDGEIDPSIISSALETVTTRLEQYAGAHDAGSNGSSARGPARR